MAPTAAKMQLRPRKPPVSDQASTTMTPSTSDGASAPTKASTSTKASTPKKAAKSKKASSSSNKSSSKKKKAALKKKPALKDTSTATAKDADTAPAAPEESIEFEAAAPAPQKFDDSKIGFMDLAPELRNQIYGYYFDWQAPKKSEDTGEWNWEVEDYHCCTLGRGGSDRDKQVRRAVCKCRGALNTNTEILRVSKLIRQEAIPVMLGSKEIRIVLPETQPNWGDDPRGTLTKVAALIPEGDHKFVKNLLLVSTTAMINCRISESEPPFNKMLHTYWPHLIEAFPNVTNVRLHIDTTWRFSLEAFDYEAFHGLMEYSKLESVVLEISNCKDFSDYPNVSDTKAKRFCEKMVEKLREKVQTLNKEISVVGTDKKRIKPKSTQTANLLPRTPPNTFLGQAPLLPGVV